MRLLALLLREIGQRKEERQPQSRLFKLGFCALTLLGQPLASEANALNIHIPVQPASHVYATSGANAGKHLGIVNAFSFGASGSPTHLGGKHLAASLPIAPSLYPSHSVSLSQTFRFNNKASLYNTEPHQIGSTAPTIAGGSSLTIAPTKNSTTENTNGTTNYGWSRTSSGHNFDAGVAKTGNALGQSTQTAGGGTSATNGNNQNAATSSSTSSVVANNSSSSGQSNGQHSTSASGNTGGQSSSGNGASQNGGFNQANNTNGSSSSSQSGTHSSTASNSSGSQSNSNSSPSSNSSSSPNATPTSSAAPSTGTTLPGSISSSTSISLNLNSQSASVHSANTVPVQLIVGGKLDAHGVIQGGTTLTIQPGQSVTAAQAVAVDQVIGGSQTLVIGSHGNAISGLITLQEGSITNVSNLIVPGKVTIDAVGYTALNPLTISGNALIKGSLLALESQASNQAVLNFGNLTVTQTGTISDSVPKPGALLSNLIAPTALDINVNSNLLNQGSITSSSAIVLNVGGSISNQSSPSGAQAIISAPTVTISTHYGSLTNSGLIAATAGNLSINSPNSLVINNTGGTLSASQGQVNFRDQSFTGASNLTINGGSISAQQAVNAYSGSGAVNVNVGTLNGLVNVSANTANVTASTSNLNLGTLNLTGDPTFYNTTGNVTISAPLIFSGAPVAIVAHGDVIFATGATSINTSGASGGNILIAAGANFTSSGPPSNSNDTTSTLTIVSGVPGGGAIQGAPITSINSSATGAGGSGGNINIVAFGGLNSTAGAIQLGNATINAGGNGAGTSGNVLIVGGSTSAGNNVAVGSISTLGGAAGSGNITVAAATPTVNGTVIVGPGGNISSGSFSAGANTAGNVSTGALSANGAAITLAAGSTATPANVQVSGTITDTRTGAGAGGSVEINVDSSSAFVIGAAGANSVSGNILVNNSKSGSGGTIEVTNTGSGGVTLTSPTNITTAASAGSGGTLNLNAGTGALNLSGGTLSTSGVGAAASGGQITLNGAAVAVSGGPLVLQSTGSTTSTGNGGTISVTATGAGSALNLGNGAGQIEIKANSGSAGGNAGSVTAAAGSNLTVNPATGLIAGAIGTTGNGATLSLTAGTAGSGNLSIASALNAGGAAGGGNGGTVTLVSHSATAFTITNSAQTNGIDGAVNVSGGGAVGSSGGTISVTNLGAGGVNIAQPANLVSSGGTLGGAGGSVTVDAGTGPLSVGAGLINANAVGPGTFNGGNISLTGATLTISGAGTVTTSANGSGGGNGGTVTVVVTSGNIPAGTTAGNLIISATGGSAGSPSGNGGSVNLSTGNGNINVSDPAAFVVGPLGANGAGSTITLNAGAAGAGNVFVNGNLSANGVGTGGAGNITITNNSATVFTIGAGATVNGVNGTITAKPGAQAGMAAPQGGLSVTNSGTGGINLLNVDDVSAPAPAGGGNGGYITLAAPNGPLTMPSGTIAVDAIGNGNGGNISLTGKALNTTAPLLLSANAAGVGNGGTISVITQNTSAMSIDAADLSFSAVGGPTSGNGGAVIVSNGGNITADPTAIQVNPNPTGGGGNGGTVSLTAGTKANGELLVTGPISVNGVGAGGGGIVNLSSNTGAGDPFIVNNPTDNGVEGNISANAGPAGGAGGSISLNNNGAGGVQVSSTSALSVNATNGHGGNLSITAGNGPINVAPGEFNTSAAGTGNFNGGNVTIVGSSVTVTPATGALSIVSNGLGSGNAGTINVMATSASSTLSVGTGNGDINVQGEGGANAGTGSSVSISTGGNLTVDAASLDLTPGANGNGASVMLCAGEAGQGNLLINGSIDVSGIGSGLGGSVYLCSSSATPFTVDPSTLTTNGIIGTIAANGGPQGGGGGSIQIYAEGTATANGGIVVTKSTDLSFAPTQNGAGGSLTLNAVNTAGGPDGSITVPTGTYNASAAGPGTFNGGSINFTGAAVNTSGGNVQLTANGSGGGNGGSVKVVTTTAAGNVSIGAGPTSLSISATGGSSGSLTGNGGTLTVSSGGNLTVDSSSLIVNPIGTNGNGGTINLTDASAAATGILQVTGDLTANGAGTGNGGTINVAYKDTTNSFVVGSAPAVNASGVSGNITANAPGSGNGGNITISNQATGSPLSINLSTAAAAITASAATATTSNVAPLGNLNFNQAGEAVSVTGPGTIDGFVNSTGSTVAIDPQATGTIVTVGTITATAGGAVISSSDGTVNVPLGNTASATANIQVTTTALLIGGTVTTSGSGAAINVDSNSNLLVSGNGLLQVSGAGANNINIVAAPGNTLTLDKSPVYAAGAAGNVLFSATGAGGQIVLNNGTNQNVRDGNPAEISSPSIVFNNGSAFTSRGATVFTVDSGPAADNQPLTITTPTGGSGLIQTIGGAINIAPQASGQPITFIGSAGGTSQLNLDGGPVTITVANAATTISSGVTVASDNNITVNANSGSLINNGVLTTSKTAGQIAIQSNAALTVGGTGTVSTTGGGAATITVAASVGSTAGNPLDFTGSQTFNAGTGAGASVTFSSPNCPPGGAPMGSINLSANAIETVASGVPLNVITPTLTMGNNSQIVDTATTGTGVNIVSGGDCPLTIIAPSSSTAAISTSGANFNIAPGPVGGPVATGEALTFGQSAPGNTATLSFTGGTVTTSVDTATTTVTAGTTVLANNNITMNVNNGTLAADGTIHSTTATGAAGRINVLSTGTLALQGVGNLTVDPTAAAGGSGGTINVNAVGALTATGGETLSANAVTGGSGGNITVQSSTFALTGNAPLTLLANAAGAGNGGTIQMSTTSTTGDINVGATAGGLIFEAEGGTTSGNGGSVSITAGRNLDLNPGSGSINVSPQSLTGNGGNVTLIGSSKSAGTLTLDQNIDANGPSGGTGNGGTIIAQNNSTSLLTVPDGAFSANSGTNGGVGGQITVTNTGTGGIEFQGNVSATGVSNTGATAGKGGQITVNSGGNVLFDGGSLNVNGVTGATSSGGTVSVKAASISQTTNSTEALTANANGTGNGGVINLTTTAAGGDIALGTNTSTTLLIQAEGGSAGSASGNGGAVTVSSAGALSILTGGAVNVSPQGNNGNGGSINLTASTVTASPMTIAASLNANGVGTGNGGAVSLTDNSNLQLAVPPGLVTANSGVTGGVGGNISVTNTGNGTGNGGISVGTLSATGAGNTAVNAGQITINAVGTNSGAVTLVGGALDVSGTAGNSYGGKITVAGGSIDQTGNQQILANASGKGNGGTISLTTVAAGGDITLGTGPSTSLVVQAQGGSAGSASGNGGSVTVSSAGALNILTNGAVSVSPQGNNGNGGTIDLTASTVTASPMTISASLNANGIGTGNGGTANLTDNSNYELTVPPNLITANSGATGGIGGTITVTNTGNGVGNGGISVGTLSATGAGNTAVATGQITVNSGGTNPGTVTLSGGTINANGTAGNSYGGNVSIVGGNLVQTVPQTITANASGSGNGGSISVSTLSNTGDISVTTGGTALTLAATGGSAGSLAGNGGTVNLSAGRNLTIADGAGIAVTPLGNNGNGGSILLTAGTATPGNVQVNQGLNADGVGSGNGGVVSIKFNDPTGTGITVGNTGTTNSFVNGSIVADASPTGTGSGGTVTIQNSAAAALTVTLDAGDITANQSPTGTLGNLNFPTNVSAPQAVSVTGNGNLTGFVNSNGTSVLIFPEPAPATTLTVGQITATTGNAAAEVLCTNGSILNIPLGSKIQTLAPGLDVVLMGATVNINGSVISNRDLNIQTNLLQGLGSYSVVRDINISCCAAGDTLTVNLPGVALNSGRNVNFDVNPANPGPIAVTVGSISANSGAGLVQLNPGQYTASITATSIAGTVTDPNTTTASDSITLAVNSATIPLTIGSFNATANANSTFTATNSAVGGAINTTGTIVANGSTGNPVTLSADNVTNTGSVTANTSALVVTSAKAGDPLTVANSGSLIAASTNVDFNGTALGSAATVTITGTGTISADAGSGMVNLNIGAGAASVVQGTIAGCVQDPNANFSNPQSGTVSLQVSSATTLQVGNFASTTSVTGVNLGNGAGTGDVQTCGNIYGANSVTLTAAGTNGNVTEGIGTISTSATGIVNLSANGPIGVGTCPNRVQLDTPQVNATAPNGSVALNDTAAVSITGANTANTATGEWVISDTSTSASAISFAPGSSLSTDYGIFYAPSGGINLANANITIGNGGVAEIVANASITSSPTNISGANSTLEIASLTGSIGTALNPVTTSTPNLSATAVNGSVYVADTFAGNVTLVTPPNLSPCGPTILNPNTALNDYFVVATNSAGTALQTANGVTITASNVAALSLDGSVGTTNVPFSTAANSITGNAENGSVNIANSNTTANGVTISPNTINGTTYSNGAATNYTLTESGNSPITINDNVTTTAANSTINLNATGGANANIVEESGILTTNGGTSGLVTLAASGTIGVGTCPNPILLNTPQVNGNAMNGSVVLNDKAAVAITGSNIVNSTTGEFALTDTSTSAASAISFADGSEIQGNELILSAPDGGINLANAQVTINNSGLVEIVSNSSLASPVSAAAISGAGTYVLASLAGSVGTALNPFLLNAPNISATAASGSVYVQDSNTGNVTIVLPTNLGPCCPVIANPNAAQTNFFVEATNSSGNALQTGTGVTVTAANLAAISQNGSVGTTGNAFSTAASTITGNAVHGIVNIADNNGTTGVTIASNTVGGTNYSNAAATSYTLTESGNGPITINGNVTTSAAHSPITLTANSGNNSNILEQSGVLTTNGGASGIVTLSASGTIGVGTCPNPILLNTPTVNGNAANGSVILNDQAAVAVTGSNVVNATSGEFALTDTSTSANSAISFASGSALSGNEMILSSTNGGINLGNANVSITNSGLAEVVANSSLTSPPVNSITGVGTFVVASLAGSVGTAANRFQVNAPNLSATATQGSVYVHDAYAGGVQIIVPTSSGPCCPVIANPNTALGIFSITTGPTPPTPPTPPKPPAPPTPLPFHKIGRHGIPKFPPPVVAQNSAGSALPQPQQNPVLQGLLTFFGRTPSSNPINIGSRTATDITEIMNYTNLDQSYIPPQHDAYTKRPCSLIEGANSFAHQFPGAETDRLVREGILPATSNADNYFNIDKGNVVFNPAKDIVVGTHEGKVYIGGGASVIVMETGHDVLVYNLHDEGAGQVRVVSGSKQVSLEPGRMVMLSRQNINDYNSLDGGCHCIGYRNIKKIALDDNLKAFYGDFSIPSAFSVVVPLKKLLFSSDPKNKRIVSKILKTSQLLTSLNPDPTPFQNGSMSR